MSLYPVPDETLLPGYVWYFGVCRAEGCALPGGGFRRQVREQHKDDEILYCSTACSKRAHKHRTKRWCPVKDCENEIIKPGAPCCGSCWAVISGMCLGKRRYDEMYALKVQIQTTWPATYCVICTSWHNTSHPTDDEFGLQAKARNILTSLIEARGQEYVDRMIERFNPANSDRKVWRARKDAISEQLGEAA